MSTSTYSPDDCSPAEWEKYRKVTLDRDNHTCRSCGYDGDDRELRVDHIHPISRGGKTRLSNLETLCFPCLNMKSKRETDEWIRQPRRDRLHLYDDELIEGSSDSRTALRKLATSPVLSFAVAASYLLATVLIAMLAWRVALAMIVVPTAVFLAWLGPHRY